MILDSCEEKGFDTKQGAQIKSRYEVGLKTLNQAISIVSGVDGRLEDL